MAFLEISDVRKQFKRNHNAFASADDDLPIYGTMASQFKDRKSTRLNSSHVALSRMPSSA